MSSIIQLAKNSSFFLRLIFKEIPFLFVISIICRIYNNIYPLVNGLILGFIINELVNSSGDPNKIFKIAFFYCIYLLIGSVINIGNNLMNNMSNFKLQQQLANNLLIDKVNQLKIKTLENSEIQNIIQRFSQNTYVFREFHRSIFLIIGMTVSIIIAIISSFQKIPIPTLIILLISLPDIYSSKFFMNKLNELNKRMTTSGRRVHNITHRITSIESIQEIRSLNAFSYLKKYIIDLNNIYYTMKYQIYRKWSLSDLTISILSSLATGFGLLQIFQLYSNGEISLSLIGFYMASLISLTSSFGNISATLSDLFDNSDKLTEMREFLNYKEEKNNENIINIEQVGVIKFNNVSFKYPNCSTYALKNISFEIKNGQKIALVGENGAGKSTIVKLLTKKYDAEEGEILIDGVNLNLISEESWYRLIGSLQQEFVTYSSLTIAENIFIGNLPLAEEEKITDFEKIVVNSNDEISQINISNLVKTSVEDANADNFIEETPNKFNSIMGKQYPNGIELSYGQQQKLAIARFFYRNPDILILDEPTSAIDALAEEKIFTNIYNKVKEKTVIIISHKFSTVRNAERIIVIENGKIIEDGSHESLMLSEGKYHKMFSTQAKGYK